MNEKRITVRRAEERGGADHGWLKTKHSFSFADYYDPDYMGYRSLRVINDDRVAPKRGFGTHPHNDMEIFTYVISGQLRHEDSMGNGRTIEAGEFQYMSAGKGVYHSEFNPSEEEAHFLQIWILPNERGGEPRYAELDTKALSADGGMTLFASADGRNGSVQMRQEAEIYYGKLEAGEQTQVSGEGYPGAWIHLIKGQIEIDGESLKEADGASIEGGGFEIQAQEEAEFILFRLK